MNSLIAKDNELKIIEGINVLLNFDDDTFKDAVNRLNVKADKFISIIYYSGRTFSIIKVLKAIAIQQNNYQKGSKKYERINEILNTRNLEAFKTILLEEITKDVSDIGDKIRKQKIIDRVFEIVSSEDMLNKFIDYENNTQSFCIEGKAVPQTEYLKILGKIFGDKNIKGELSNVNMISNSFYIPQLENYKRRYSKLFDKINIDRYVNAEYEFNEIKQDAQMKDTVIRRGEEPEWNINEELYKSIFQNMPEGLILEEQAIYIYYKLCEGLVYDEGYFYKNRIEDNRYENIFSKEHLESIKLGSKITCFDFARVFAKLVNELDENIEAVIIAEGENKGHFRTGFYTDKVSVMLEAVNIRSGKANDLMKAKNGVKLEGIKIISDREGIIEKALNKVGKLIFGVRQVSIYEYVTDLIEKSIEEQSSGFEEKLKSFIDVMKENKISGNEAVQTFNIFDRMDFFGENIDKVFLGRREYQNGKANYKRMILMRNRENSCYKYYLLDSETLVWIGCETSEISEILKAGEFFYESERHKMPEDFER